ncbi:MAG TPA: hypothetical protein VEK15_06300 [Vicinamibacteria bacterium]|nr:hypothetical protein [Vicinamibacteria bacterium]
MDRFVLTLSCLLAPAAVHAELVDRIVAIVDQDVITLSEAEKAQQMAELRALPQTSLSEVVDRLIEQRLIGREVERFSSEPVPEELVDRAFAEVRDRFSSDEEFHGAVSELALSTDEIKAELRLQIRVTRYLEKRFRALTYVSVDEVNRFFEEELLPDLPSGAAPPDPKEHAEAIRRILAERKFNERVEQWIGELTSRARIRRYVW